VTYPMKKASAKKNDSDLRPEYDLTQLKGGVRGKYYRQATAEKKGRRIKDLFDEANRLAALDIPLTETEVEAEIAAIRQAKGRRIAKEDV
jgi:hypothetical protein